MYSCWNVDSKLRPSFEVLEKNISNLLIGKHYSELNELYSKTNSNHLNDEQPDFLAQMADPSYELPLTPKYTTIYRK